MLEGWKPTLFFFSILESQVSTPYLTDTVCHCFVAVADTIGSMQGWSP